MNIIPKEKVVNEFNKYQERDGHVIAAAIVADKFKLKYSTVLALVAEYNKTKV